MATGSGKTFTAVSFLYRHAEMLGDSHRGVLMVRDELAGWFGSSAR